MGRWGYNYGFWCLERESVCVISWSCLLWIAGWRGLNMCATSWRRGGGELALAVGLPLTICWVALHIGAIRWISKCELRVRDVELPKTRR